MVRRIISVFSVFVILFSCSFSAYADVVDAGSYVASNFWDFLQGNEFDYNLNFWKNVTGYFVGKECPSSPDSYHHGSKPAFGSSSGGSDENGRFGWATCDYCGKQFKYYSSFSGGSGGGFSKSDLQQSYDAQVAELPAPVYGADGSIYVIPLISFWDENRRVSSSYLSNGESYENRPYQYSFNYPLFRRENFIDINGRYSSYCFGVRLKYVMPFLGSCELLFSSVTCSVIGQTVDMSVSSSSSSGIHYYSAGSEINMELLSESVSMLHEGNFLLAGNFVNIYLHDLRLKLTPVDTGTPTGTIYNIQSRPTSITGDYGIIGDNGQIIKVESDKIVNETNNNYYNPATGETHTMSDWTYNYEDRSYTVTTEAGDTVTITYGDENVVIKEGDTVYNVYYLVNGSGSEAPGPDVPDVCDHTWTETGRTEPTCTTAGKVTSICSKCNQTKTETIPATGHSWVVDRTVQTTYDEEGNLLQQGYTIYSCSICGEQYKDMEGTGPPGGEGEKSIWEKIGDFFGTIGGGFIDIIGAIAGKLLDALIALAEMLMGKLKTVVETVLSIFDEVPALFGGFLDFLAAIFPFLPPEITTILTFGVIAITFIGILKAVRR